jgi:hypothetical protein
MGEHASAITRVSTALRLNPLDPLVYRVHGLLAYAYFFSGQDEEALLWADKAFLASAGRPWQHIVSERVLPYCLHRIIQHVAATYDYAMPEGAIVS